MKHLSGLKAILEASLGRHQQRIDCLTRFMLALIKVRAVNLAEITSAYGGQGQLSSRYRRLLRFFSSFEFSRDQIAQFIYGLDWLHQALCGDYIQRKLIRTCIKLLSSGPIPSGQTTNPTWFCRVQSIEGLHSHL